MPLQPSIAVSGVRNSCETTARNSSFARLAASAEVRATRSLRRRSCRARSASFASVTSATMQTAPSAPPSASRTGSILMRSQRPPRSSS